MSSMAWDAIQMGIDPVMSPGGGTWEDNGRQSHKNRTRRNTKKETGMTPEQLRAFALLTAPPRIDKYKVGDTVKLQSGGPLMTIKKVDENIITCRWFNNNNDINETQFSKSELYNVNENDQIDINKDEIPFIDINEDEIPF